DHEATADDIERPPEAFNLSDSEEMNAANNKDTSEGGKIKALLNVLRRMIGVKDLAAIRLSLPANLLEPVPNLEYWNYMDRADLFSVVGDLDDPLDRMLAVLRFTFTKELKFVHGKICKPYNSILGEFFQCHWDVQVPEDAEKVGYLPTMALRVDSPSLLPLASAASSSGSSIKSGKASKSDRRTASTKGGSSKTRRGLSRLLTGTRNKVTPNSANSTANTDSSSNSLKSPALSAQKPDQEVPDADNDDDDQSVAGSFKTSKSEAEGRRVCFLTEQVSHHPPISSFFVDCKDAGVQLRGVDQLSAKFTGTNIKIFPGDRNKGIFLGLTDKARCGADGEEYQITHPTASINGLLRGSLWVSVQNQVYVTCRGGKRANDNGKRLRAITEYKDESWVGKAKYALEGVVYEYEEEKEDPEQYTTIRDVPADRVIMTFEGTWKGQIHWKLKGEKESRLLIDLTELDPIKAIKVRPLESQEEMESRKIWKDVTESILNKEFGTATKHKQTIEQQQRESAAERKRKGQEFVPKFFDPNIDDGRPKLIEAGRAALDGEHELAGY
ncbi:uncharacterized protein FA14DRAFT_112093, partial [Meira miltonrushii]